jgi:hypothetical protein
MSNRAPQNWSDSGIFTAPPSLASTAKHALPLVAIGEVECQADRRARCTGLLLVESVRRHAADVLASKRACMICCFLASGAFIGPSERIAIEPQAGLNATSQTCFGHARSCKPAAAMSGDVRIDEWIYH